MNPIDLLNEFYSLENSDTEAGDNEPLSEKTQVSLGKRAYSSKAKTDHLHGEKKPGKYLDPSTGAYFNTIEEFKMIRALSAIDKLEQLGTEKSVLKTLFMAKKKKLNYFHHELKNN